MVQATSTRLQRERGIYRCEFATGGITIGTRGDRGNIPFVVEQWLGCPPQTAMQDGTSGHGSRGTVSPAETCDGAKQDAHSAMVATADHHIGRCSAIPPSCLR